MQITLLCVIRVAIYLINKILNWSSEFFDMEMGKSNTCARVWRAMTWRSNSVRYSRATFWTNHDVFKHNEQYSWCIADPIGRGSKARFCGISFDGVTGSYPTGAMDVCVLWVMCVVWWREWSLVQRSPNECSVSESDLEAPKKGRHWATSSCCVMERKTEMSVLSSYISELSQTERRFIQRHSASL
jgi:hypothetical protein